MAQYPHPENGRNAEISCNQTVGAGGRDARKAESVTATFRGDLAADLLQMQPWATADTIIDGGQGQASV